MAMGWCGFIFDLVRLFLILAGLFGFWNGVGFRFIFLACSCYAMGLYTLYIHCYGVAYCYGYFTSGQMGWMDEKLACG